MLGTRESLNWLKENEGINFLAKQISNYKNEKNITLIKMLINNLGLNLETKLNEEGMTVLMLAAREGCLKIVKLLIKAGVQINAQDKNGDTALMYVLKSADSCDCNVWEKPCSKFLEILEYLVKHGANMFLENNAGQSVYKMRKNLSKRAYIGTKISLLASWARLGRPELEKSNSSNCIVG